VVHGARLASTHGARLLDGGRRTEGNLSKLPECPAETSGRQWSHEAREALARRTRTQHLASVTSQRL
jgi:hypothetical protein